MAKCSLQSESEKELSISLKWNDVSALEEAKTTMMEVLERKDCSCCEELQNEVAEMKECINKNKEAMARMEETIGRNKLTLCGAGLQDSTKIKDSQITAIDYWKYPDRQPKHGRLFGTSGVGAWAANHSNVNDWIEVDLGQPRTIYGIATQGRVNKRQWVTSYNVLYNSESCDEHETVSDDAGKSVVFPGNTDQTTPVINSFPRPITARYFRVQVLTWVGWIAMRFDLLLC